MLCYRCGSHVPDESESCSHCGAALSGGQVRPTTGTFSRKRLQRKVVAGAPYQPNQRVAGRYLIRDTIGEGPTGFVFRAHDEVIDVEVALKTVSGRLVQTDEELKHFGKTIRLGRKHASHYVALNYDDGVDEGRPYFTSQYLEGLSLRKIIDLRLSKGQFFDVQEIHPIIVQIANALTAAHDVGPHTDVKPQNIVVLPDLLKLTDFALGAAIPRLPFVQAMKAAKVEAYLAPEFNTGQVIDGRSDVYALGVILGEMLTGLLPKDSIPELHVRNPEVSKGLEGVYRKAVNANPMARHQTPEAFVTAFEKAVKKVSPPPLKSKAEPAIGDGAPSSGGGAALKLVPAPPPPPAPRLSASDPVSAETEVDDSLLVNPPTPPMQPGLIEPPATSAKFDGSNKEETVSVQYEHLHPNAPPRRIRWLFVAAMLLLSLVFGAALALLVTNDGPPTVSSVDGIEGVNDDPIGGEGPNSGSFNNAPTSLEDPDDSSGESDGPNDDGKGVEVSGNAAPEPERPCPVGMRLVERGKFRFGTPANDPLMGFDENALKILTLASFCIDTYEFPNSRGARPRVNVGWGEARRLCAATGKRLCTEREWEKACKGPRNARFPYGSRYNAAICNTENAKGEDRKLSASASFQRCRSGYGVADMSGNAWEWTATNYTSGPDKTLKGGAFNRTDYAARCSARKNSAPGSRANDVGFRCCASARMNR